MPNEIPSENRSVLIPLFEPCRHDRVMIDGVIEGAFGTAYADSPDRPAVARLDAGSFTMLGGNPFAAGVRNLLRGAPISFVTPQTSEWRGLLDDEFGNRVFVLRFTKFSAAALNPARLEALARTVPPEFELRSIDRDLASRLSSDTGNENFLECFSSLDDFLERGLGYCVVREGTIVSAATSMARSSRGIDIEVETIAAFRRQGLATAVTARLVLTCLEQGLTPHWLAANEVSEALALKLGLVREEVYETLGIRPQS